MKLTTYFVALALCASAVSMAAPMPPVGEGSGLFSKAVKGLKRLGSSSSRKTGEETGFGSASLRPDEVRSDRDHIPSYAPSPEHSASHGSASPAGSPIHREAPYDITHHHAAPPTRVQQPYTPMQREEPYPGAFVSPYHHDPYAGYLRPPHDYPMSGHGFHDTTRTADPYHASTGIHEHQDRTIQDYYFPEVQGLPHTHYSTQPGVPQDSYMHPSYGGHVPRGEHVEPQENPYVYGHNGWLSGQ